MKKALVYLSYLFLWEFLSLSMGNALILPSVQSILFSMVNFGLSAHFWLSVTQTLLRVLMGTGLSFILALGLALLVYEKPKLKVFFEPVLAISKSIPNISYILIILIWFSRDVSVTLISLLVVFPILYQQFLVALLSIETDLLEVEKLYPETRMNHYLKVLLPLMRLSLLEGLISALSLGFKVGVMAEILGQVQPGLGYLMYVSKVNIEMVDLFALSAWLIVFVILIEKGIRRWIKL